MLAFIATRNGPRESVERKNFSVYNDTPALPEWVILVLSPAQAGEPMREGAPMANGPVQSPDMRMAIGPYSHTVRAGDFMFVAGQPGIDPSSGSVPLGGVDAEARQAFVNLRTVVEASGADLGRVVRTTVFLANADDFPAMNQPFAELLPSAPPVRATPIVGLPRVCASRSTRRCSSADAMKERASAPMLMTGP